MYLKSLIRERDRLISTLGCTIFFERWTVDIDTAQQQEALSSIEVNEPFPLEIPPLLGFSASTSSRRRIEADREVNFIDYQRVWTNNNIASVVVHIETGQLLKGNDVFMKSVRFFRLTGRLFQFDSEEEINQLSLFDIVIVDDLSLFWRFASRR